ncbi:hypothetical protein AGLY_005945 [Aphis glycines]|uniref:Uncharacterized protein n=1 Tax=Aphis glycines TaxID=307491 RepID=A0A6G0TSV7_APHGL|nr:hypothetical protein AGLY_005945 [Aphis glycines]
MHPIIIWDRAYQFSSPAVNLQPFVTPIEFFICVAKDKSFSVPIFNIWVLSLQNFQRVPYQQYSGIKRQALSIFSTSIFPRNPVLPVTKTVPFLNVSGIQASIINNCSIKTPIIDFVVLKDVNCKRYFSKLKIIKNRLRSSLSQEILESFMMMSVEKELLEEVSFDDILKHFYKAAKLYFPLGRQYPSPPLSRSYTVYRFYENNSLPSTQALLTEGSHPYCQNTFNTAIRVLYRPLALAVPWFAKVLNTYTQNTFEKHLDVNSELRKAGHAYDINNNDKTYQPYFG